MRPRTDTNSRSALASTTSAPETSETTGDLQLGCIFCHKDIPANQTVIFWPVGGYFLVAHVHCATSQVTL